MEQATQCMQIYRWQQTGGHEQGGGVVCLQEPHKTARTNAKSCSSEKRAPWQGCRLGTEGLGKDLVTSSVGKALGVLTGSKVPREAVLSPSLELGKTEPDKIPKNPNTIRPHGCTCLEPEAGLKNVLRSLFNLKYHIL